jgi:hypothetical protein
VIDVAPLGRRLAFLALAAGVGVLAGCASKGQDAGEGARTPSAASESAESGSAVLDACALIEAEDITRLLGVPVEGKPTSTDPKFPPGCIWENPANLESIALEVGSPGTAPGNTLSAPEAGFPELTTPGPDGMRFLGSGSVEFAAGGRSNNVQVAVLHMLSGGQADAAAVDLARKIGPKIPE